MWPREKRRAHGAHPVRLLYSPFFTGFPFMQLTAQFAPLSEIQADWLIVGVWEDESFTGALAQLDAQLGGALARLQQAGDITGKPNELISLLGQGAAAAERLLLVGLGKRTT